mgnify:CR=1 FL=1
MRLLLLLLRGVFFMQASLSSMLTLDVRRGELLGLLRACVNLMRPECRGLSVSVDEGLRNASSFNTEGQLTCPAPRGFSSCRVEVVRIAFAQQPPHLATAVEHTAPQTVEPTVDHDGLAAAVAESPPQQSPSPSSHGATRRVSSPSTHHEPSHPPQRQRLQPTPAVAPHGDEALVTSTDSPITTTGIAHQARLTLGRLSSMVEELQARGQRLNERLVRAAADARGSDATANTEPRQLPAVRSPASVESVGTVPRVGAASGMTMQLRVPTSVEVGDSFTLHFENPGAHPIRAHPDKDSVVLVRLKDGAVDSRWQVRCGAVGTLHGMMQTASLGCVLYQAYHRVYRVSSSLLRAGELVWGAHSGPPVSGNYRVDYVRNGVVLYRSNTMRAVLRACHSVSTDGSDL